MVKLLTQRELAEKWQVSIRAIEKWRQQGVLEPCKGIPAIRFSQEHIAELEGIEKKPVSPLRVKQLERQLEQARKEIEELRGALARILAEGSRLFAKKDA